MGIMKEVRLAELLSAINDKETKIIDVRPIDAYNGWKLMTEARGGHIKGTKSLPAKWTNFMDWIEIVNSKGISHHHRIVVYGYDKTKTEKVADRFFNVGYNDVKVYNHFIDEWSSNPENHL